MKKLVSLLLVLAMAAAMLASCGGGNSSQSKTESESTSESSSESTSESESTRDWSTVNFGGEDLKVSISVNMDRECTFPAADIYTRGPDHVSSDNVQKMVSDRNLQVASTLGLNVIYEETDWHWDEVYPHLQQLVQLGSADAPDIYNNDIFGLLRGMLNNQFRNVLDPDASMGEKSYFDFTHESWYWDYMQGTSFTSEKIYLVAGDYFIDMIRMAWVLYVNTELFNEVWSSAFGTTEDLYRLVLEGGFDYSYLAFFFEGGHRDTVNTGVTDKEDEVIGLIASSCFNRMLLWSGGLTAAIVDDGGARIGVRETLPDFYEMCQAYCSMYQAPGLLRTTGNLDATELFLQKTSLFVSAVLGEMESEQVRGVEGLTKGVLPAPKYIADQQEEYHTVVHDQAEIAAILNTTSKFTEATAWLQYSNELSVPVLKEYYDKSLKLKYNDDPLNKQMIDLVHDTIDDPFESVLMNYILGSATEDSQQPITIIDACAKEFKDTFNSDYESRLDAYISKFEEVYDMYMDLD